MKNGIYKVTFTTTTGTIAEAVCMFQDDKFVGADFLHNYQGHARYDGETLVIWMKCIKQSAQVVTMLPLPDEFELEWTGPDTMHGFALEAKILGSGARISAVGRLLE